MTTLPEQLGLLRFRASRPDFYFDQDNPLWPDEAELELSLPTISGMTPGEIRAAVAREVVEQEEQARASVRARGWSVLGAKKVRRASPYDRAKSWEALRGRNPQFAVGRHQKQAFFDAVAAMRAFRSAYCATLTQWRQGLRDVMFPAGTWVMRVLHGAGVAATT